MADDIEKYVEENDLPHIEKDGSESKSEGEGKSEGGEGKSKGGEFKAEQEMAFEQDFAANFESDLVRLTKMQEHIFEEQEVKHKALDAMVDSVQKRLFKQCEHIPRGPKLSMCLMEKSRMLEEIIEKYIKENDIEDS